MLLPVDGAPGQPLLKCKPPQLHGVPNAWLVLLLVY